eukprot:5355492-Pyramimonas_sp.AAC.1
MFGKPGAESGGALTVCVVAGLSRRRPQDPAPGSLWSTRTTKMPSDAVPPPFRALTTRCSLFVSGANATPAGVKSVAWPRSALPQPVM